MEGRIQDGLEVTLMPGMRDYLGRQYNPNEILRQVMGRTIIGELGCRSSRTIDLSNASHYWHDFGMDDNMDLLATIKVLDTPSGLLLRAMMAEGRPLRTWGRFFGVLDSKKNSVSEATVVSWDVGATDGR